MKAGKGNGWNRIILRWKWERVDDVIVKLREMVRTGLGEYYSKVNVSKARGWIWRILLVSPRWGKKAKIVELKLL